MDLNFNKNEDHNKLLSAALRQKLVKVKLGGGKSRVEKQHAKGKMTVANCSSCRQMVIAYNGRTPTERPAVKER